METSPFTCPVHRVQLEQEAECLVCPTAPDACGYPIVDGIPRFVPQDNYAKSFGVQWRRFAKTQLDSHSGLRVSERRLHESTQWPRNLEGEKILEVGSGSGRFTEVLLRTGANVFSFDFSSAVETTVVNNRSSRLVACQADIFSIPFPDGFFDKVICLGVLQHTPAPEAAFRSIARKVRNGGQLVVDIYPLEIRYLASMAGKYLFRPLFRALFRVCGETRMLRYFEWHTRALLPVRDALARGPRWLKIVSHLVPVADYTGLPLEPADRLEWCVQGTYDWYGARYDKPQSLRTLRRWFIEAGFERLCFDHTGFFVGRGVKVGASSELGRYAANLAV